MKFLKMISWIVLGLLFVGIGAWMALNKNLFGVPILLVAFWIFMSIKIIGSAEMAIFVWLGEPVGFRDSGLCFVPWLLGELERYPKKMYNFDYRAREVVTQAGRYKSEKEDKETYYGSQVLKVSSVVYLNFPREPRSKETGDDLLAVEIDEGGIEKTHPLIKILRAQVPMKDEELKNWTEEAVLGALRVAFGRMTWRRAVEDIKEVTKEAENVFKSADGALIRAGFSKKGIQLVIAEIDLPEQLENAMPEVDRQRLEADAAPWEAEQRAEETGGAVVQIFCKMTGMTRADVEKALKEKPEDFVKRYESFWEKSWDTIYRRMAIDGKAYLDIRTQNPLLDLIALLKRTLSGKGEEEKQERKEEEVKTEKPLSSETKRVMKSVGEALKKRKRKRRS